MEDKIKHSDVFRLKKDDMLELKKIVDEFYVLEAELKKKFNLTLNDLGSIEHYILKKFD